MKIIVHRPDLEAPPADPAAPVRPATTPAALKLAHLRRAVRRWVAGGCELAPGAVRKVRRGVCAACPYWSPAGNWGLGECKAPGCGCTRAKVWLATEACPLGRWESRHPREGASGSGASVLVTKTGPKTAHFGGVLS